LRTSGHEAGEGEEGMGPSRWLIGSAALAVLLTTGAQAQDHLKVAVGARGVGETFVPELGQNAGIFKKHGLTLDVLYTQGGGETQQIVVSNSAQIGIANGFLGTLGAFAKGAPLRVIGSTFTGGSQLFWYVRADSPIKSLKDTAGKTVAFSTNGSSTHTAVLALKKFSGVDFKPTATGAAPATFTQLMSGQIDVGWAGAPFGVDAVEQGRTRVIAKASDDPGARPADHPADRRERRRACAAQGRVCALHARLSRGARLGLCDARGAQGLCRMVEHLRGDSQTGAR
jgi:NitT/TauT family transport system substrate-binding protein